MLLSHDITNNKPKQRGGSGQPSRALGGSDTWDKADNNAMPVRAKGQPNLRRGLLYSLDEEEMTDNIFDQGASTDNFSGLHMDPKSSKKETNSPSISGSSHGASIESENRRKGKSKRSKKKKTVLPTRLPTKWLTDGPTKDEGKGGSGRGSILVTDSYDAVGSFRGHCVDADIVPYNLVRVKQDNDLESCSLFCHSLDLEGHVGLSIGQSPPDDAEGNEDMSPLCSCWYDNGVLPRDLPLNITVFYSNDAGSGPVAGGSGPPFYQCYPYKNYIPRTEVSPPNLYVSVSRADNIGPAGSHFTFDEAEWRDVFGVDKMMELPDEGNVNQWREDELVWSGTVRIWSEKTGRRNPIENGVFEDGDLLEPSVPPDEGDANLTALCQDIDCGFYQASDCRSDDEGVEERLNSTDRMFDPHARCLCCANIESNECNVTDGRLLKAVVLLLEGDKGGVMESREIESRLSAEFPNCTEEYLEEVIHNNTNVQKQINKLFVEVGEKYAKNLTHYAAESVASTILQFGNDPIHYDIGIETSNFSSYADFKENFNPIEKIVGHGSSFIKAFSNGPLSGSDDVFNKVSDVEEACEGIEMNKEELDLLLYGYGSINDKTLMGLVFDKQFKDREKASEKIQAHFHYDRRGQGMGMSNATYQEPTLLEKFTSRRKLSNEESPPQHDIISSELNQLQNQVAALRRAIPMHSDFLLRRLEVAKQDECSNRLDCAASELESLYDSVSMYLFTVVSGLEGLENILSQIRDLGEVLSSTSRVIQTIMMASNVLRLVPGFVGAIINTVRAVISPLARSFTNAMNRISRVIGRATTQYLTGIERAIAVVTSVYSVIGTVSGTARAMVDLSESTCIRTASSELFGQDLFSVFETGAEGLIEFAHNYRNNLELLNDALLGPVWKDIRDTFSSVIAAVEPVSRVLSPLVALQQIMDAEISIPWINLPYAIERVGDTRCIPRGGGVDYDSHRGVLSPNTCWENTPRNWNIPVTDPFSFRRSCSHNDLPGSSFFGQCYNENFRRPNRFWPPQNELGWCRRSRWPRVRYPCISRTCSSNFGRDWFRNLVHCVQNCPSNRHESLGFCYRRTCPNDFTVSSRGKFCNGRSRRISRHSARCDHIEDSRASIGIHGPGCYTSCRSGFREIVGFCVPTGIGGYLRISVQSMIDAFNDVIEFIKDLPVVNEILRGIDAAMDYVMSNVIEAIDNVLGGLQIDLELPHQIISEILPFLDLVDISLPQLPDLSDITDLPNIIVNEALEIIPEPLSTIINNCLDSFDLDCIKNEIPMVGDIINSADKISRNLGELVPRLIETAAQLLSTMTCTRMETITIPVGQAVRQHMQIPIDLGSDCDVQIPMCTGVDFLSGSELVLTNIVGDLVNDFGESLLDLLRAVEQIIFSGTAAMDGSTVATDDDEDCSIFPILIINVPSSKVIDRLFGTELSKWEGRNFRIPNTRAAVIFESAFVFKLELGIIWSRVRWSDPMSLINSLALKITPQIEAELSILRDEIASIRYVMEEGIKMAWNTNNIDIDSIWSIGEPCWGSLVNRESIPEFRGTFRTPVYTEIAGTGTNPILGGACIRHMNRARDILLRTNGNDCTLWDMNKVLENLLVQIGENRPITDNEEAVARLERCYQYWMKGSFAFDQARTHITEFQSFMEGRREEARKFRAEIFDMGNDLGWMDPYRNLSEVGRGDSIWNIGGICYHPFARTDGLLLTKNFNTRVNPKPYPAQRTGSADWNNFIDPKEREDLKERCRTYIWQAEEYLLPRDYFFGPPYGSCKPKDMLLALNTFHEDSSFEVISTCGSLWRSQLAMVNSSLNDFLMTSSTTSTTTSTTSPPPEPSSSIAAIATSPDLKVSSRMSSDLESLESLLVEAMETIRGETEILEYIDLPTGTWLNTILPPLSDQSCERDGYGSVGRGFMIGVVTPLRTGSGISATLDIYDQIIPEASLFHGFDVGSWETGCYIQFQLNDLSLASIRNVLLVLPVLPWSIRNVLLGRAKPIPDRAQITLEFKYHFQLLPVDKGFWTNPLDSLCRTNQPSEQPSITPTNQPSEQPSISEAPTPVPTAPLPPPPTVGIQCSSTDDCTIGLFCFRRWCGAMVVCRYGTCSERFPAGTHCPRHHGGDACISRTCYNGSCT